MVSNVITIGSDLVCDFVINSITMPYHREEIIKRIQPIHAQLFIDDSVYYLRAFSGDIYINDIYVSSPLFETMILNGEVQIVNHAIRLKFDDKISIAGIDIFWQQWMVGLGLKCDTCKYLPLHQPNDEWCQYCKQCYRNPAPYIYGYSPKYAEDKGFYNYTDCNQCGLKPDWCVECNFRMNPEPLNRSFKEHIDMYLQRLMAGPAKP